MVQWLRTHCNAEDAGLIPGWETKIPHAAQQLSPKIPWVMRTYEVPSWLPRLGSGGPRHSKQEGRFGLQVISLDPGSGLIPHYL